MNRSLSFSDLWTFLECPQEYLARLRRQKQKRSKEQLVGDATHAIAENNGETSESIRVFIEKEISLLPVEDREATRKRIELVSANAQEMAESDEDSDDSDRESVYRWLFAQLGWTLCAKPDKVDFVKEGGREIMEITDYKSGSSHEYLDPESGEVIYRPKRKHKEQIYFFAMVLSQALNWTGPVRMRIRYWGNKAECKPMWYSHRRTQEALAELAGHIKRIEQYLAQQSFPAKPGFWCKDCPLAETCESNRQYKSVLSGNSTIDLADRRTEQQLAIA